MEVLKRAHDGRSELGLFLSPFLMQIYFLYYAESELCQHIKPRSRSGETATYCTLSASLTFVVMNDGWFSVFIHRIER
jgi:hypothetical protein